MARANNLTVVDSTAERDEIKEVQLLSRKDTNRIRLWRVVVTAVLLITAVTVTVTTYTILRKEQHQNFTSAFEKFARTVGDAAVNQQIILRDSFRGSSESLTVDAIRTNQQWPNFSTPYYETYAGRALRRSRGETTALFTHVPAEGRQAWIEYANDHLHEWARKGHILKYGNLDRLNESNYVPEMTKKNPNGGGFISDDMWYEYWPMWLYSPPPAQYGAVNWNLINVPDYENIIKAMKILRGEALICPVRSSVSTGTAFTHEEHLKMHSKLKTGSLPNHPHTFLFTPVYEELNNPESNFVGVLSGGFAWDFSLRFLLPDNVAGMIAIILNDCNQTYTYEISGEDAYYLGAGDLHESKYDSFKVVRELSLLTHPLANSTPGHCQYTMHLYPSSTFEKSYDKNTPELFAGVVAFTFLMVALVFVVYDILVHQRNMKLVANAARSNAVVTSLFPGTMRDRVLQQQTVPFGTKSKMKSFLKNGQEVNGEDSKPLADLFLQTTILFADITGFTAWSSVREPAQVFQLLETVYSSFDELAKNHRIFKVETVGDCYVAAAGIPEPRTDHATAMARFGRDCIYRMSTLTKELEVTLGPDTGDLGLRIGIHSGPVTAGVLRGERARFQLFGDTMNTTARLESSGSKGRIHASQETADLLAKAGKSHWLTQRSDLVNAKGKGSMKSFWVTLKMKKKDACSDASVSSYANSISDADLENEDERAKRERLIDWNVEMLTRLLKQIVARQNAVLAKRNSSTYNHKNGIMCDEASMSRSARPIDDVMEIIALPQFDAGASREQQSPDQVELSTDVVNQLRDLITVISHMYYENPFHNFDHASHVVMSVIKLMSRIVAPDSLIEEDHDVGPYSHASSLHDHTYGITSDPLTQFACAFSALIHDVDHTGVPNSQLMLEKKELGEIYGGRSVAEQNSLDVSWELLMQSRFKELRATLYTTEAELYRFRQLVVNGVMATDISDKELKALRNGRWDKAFSGVEELVGKGGVRDDINRKATIVIEHLIQASDVSHTMQHWHVYRKWNEHLFREMYKAFIDGRAEKNPAEFWYEGEIGFFDFYIIPLAKKLKECGVFGVSSDEYLNYALNNRKEWEMRGQQVVAEMMENVEETFGLVPS